MEKPVADIVSAYGSRNSVTPVGLPALIESVHEALSQLGAVEAVPKLRLSCQQCRFGNPLHRTF
jgi:predicted transcriptional regulator